MALSNVIYGVHVGPGMGNYIDAKLLKKQYGIGFIMADMMAMVSSDPNDDNNRDIKYWSSLVQQAWDADIPIFGVIRHHALWSDSALDNVLKHIQVVKKQMMNKAQSVSGLFVEPITGIDPGNGKPIAPKYLDERTRMMIDETQKIYTRTWVGAHLNRGFINTYCPTMENWAGKYMLYWAQWKQQPPQSAAWADLPRPESGPSNFPPINKAVNSLTGNPAFWNWSGGYYNNLDGIWMDEAQTQRGTPKLSLFFGSKLELYQLAFYNEHGEATTPTVPPETDDDDNDTPVVENKMLNSLEKAIDAFVLAWQKSKEEE